MDSNKKIAGKISKLIEEAAASVDNKNLEEVSNTLNKKVYDLTSGLVNISLVKRNVRGGGTCINVSMINTECVKKYHMSDGKHWNGLISVIASKNEILRGLNDISTVSDKNEDKNKVSSNEIKKSEVKNTDVNTLMNTPMFSAMISEEFVNALTETISNKVIEKVASTFIDSINHVKMNMNKLIKPVVQTLVSENTPVVNEAKRPDGKKVSTVSKQDSDEETSETVLTGKYTKRVRPRNYKQGSYQHTKDTHTIRIRTDKNGLLAPAVIDASIASNLYEEGLCNIKLTEGSDKHGIYLVFSKENGGKDTRTKKGSKYTSKLRIYGINKTTGVPTTYSISSQGIQKSIIDFLGKKVMNKNEEIIVPFQEIKNTESNTRVIKITRM
jgi:hypothetical protein